MAEAEALTLLGFDAGPYMKAHAIPEKGDPGWMRMRWSGVPGLWKAAERHTRDPNLGLHAATALSMVQPGFFPYAMLTAANLRDSFRFFETYQELCIDVRLLSLEERQDLDVIALHSVLRPAPSRFHAEFLLTLLTRAARYMLGEEFVPHSIHLRRSAGPRGAEFETVFRCPVHFDRVCDEMLVDHAWMLKPSPYSHPATMATFRGHAAQLLHAHSAPTWGSRVDALVTRFLPEGEGTIDRVAQHLSTTPRTLQRRLAAEGQTFDAIRDTARHQRAVELLRSGDLSMSLIASDLGFSDVRSFRRAFRRWTGQTPSEISQTKGLGG